MPNNRIKLKLEYFYWWLRSKKEKELNNDHFQPFFTTHFEIDLSFYDSKTILDIGCGPRGSLEWATNSITYAIDPLVDKYKKFGLDQHHTNYLNAVCEAIPFEDDYFDVISSFNSLDHVDELEQSIHEIKRVLKSNGTFLLIADIHNRKTICEPNGFSWDIVEKFKPEFELVSEKQYEGENMYKSIRKGIRYNHENNKERYGVLMAKFIKS